MEQLYINCQILLKWLCYFPSPPVMCGSSSSCARFLTSMVLPVFGVSALWMSMKWYLIIFPFAFPKWLKKLNIFSCAYWLLVFLWSVCLPFAHFHKVFPFFNICRSFYVLNMSHLWVMHIINIYPVGGFAYNRFYILKHI